ncbi:MAG TPA: 3-hydroxyacyl-CoA dehydrogenase NAD-binding domain-containing protein, partial [Candidatus Limnocylindrales bacterium]|nr:3-hydroxyacyl-CoA dehydrogenase NAD-binding domain-containing protein [Candidatus Limnocylindrales bacterium]
MKQIYVAGAGLMGAGIAQTAITCGLEVTLREVDEALANRGVEHIRKRLDSLVQKGKMTASDRDAALARLHATTSLEAAGRADFVIEAITENFEAKRELFKRLDGICRPEAILASNTSSIPITRMAAVTKRPDRFIGMHFFNPVPVMPLVELTRGRDTSDATVTSTLELARTMGKTPITSLDYPGFIVNRMLVPFINEAIRALMEGLGSREDIDLGAKLGLHHPMGPLELADFVGLDTHVHICDVLYEGLHDPKFAAPPLLRQLV